jgi:hypothetical protein
VYYEAGDYVFGFVASHDGLDLNITLAVTVAVVPNKGQLVAGWEVRYGRLSAYSFVDGNPPDEEIAKACDRITTLIQNAQ